MATAKKQEFDPSGIGIKKSGIFGLPFTRKSAKVIILPVPWEATVSYRGGTAKAPSAIFDASFQVDLFDPDIKNAWECGIFMEPISDKWLGKSNLLRKKTEKCIRHLEKGGSVNDSKIEKFQRDIDEGSRELNKWVRKKSSEILKEGKLLVVLGGEHSSPLGLMQAIAKSYPSFGILHIDAHADMRKSYEGLEFSHASIMFNALKIQKMKSLVQVGIRDFSEEEANLAARQGKRVRTFTDRQIKKAIFNGIPWKNICSDIISCLPKNTYISFDVDGLDPSLCPNTGTPVPGGLQFEEVFFLFEELKRAGKKIIGFDLCETAPGKFSETDAITSAHILYRLAVLAAH